ncbi:MAG: DUF2330 domain-containing protein [Acidobacteria bacterium]|nr:DUF2330 domain-containing protein [Acidobacteriota bacterium]MCA1612180.1 DUF2330 domain-containing protein [Acidobacteriota bacterium]
MRRSWLYALALCLFALAPSRPARAFCGFYVAKADAKLFNRSSQVALVREGNRTVLTMGSDFQGDPKEFAVVIPVPTPIEKEQIHIGDPKLLMRLDAYSSPRLVEYHDPDPCGRRDEMRKMSVNGAMLPQAAAVREKEKSLGVTIEARYTVGEYDILILSAKDSGGLAKWLQSNGYRIPAGAAEVLDSYVRQNMRFFVAKVNLGEKARLGFSSLRPIQVAYESPKFMLPIRLGMVNANGPQELFVYTLTRKGRVEAVNYRTVRLPSDTDVPLFVKDRFPDFYRALFSRQVKHEGSAAVFTEYAWDMGWCDPCAAEPLTAAELRGVGVFWLPDAAGAGASGASDVFLTRLHVRYDAAHFPEDLAFQETADRQNFQARYVLHHPFAGTVSCDAGDYRDSLRSRRESEARNVIALTGWSADEVRRRMGVTAAELDTRKWYERLWN